MQHSSLGRQNVNIINFELFHQIYPQLGFVHQNIKNVAKMSNFKIFIYLIKFALNYDMQQMNLSRKNVRILNVYLFNQICPQLIYATAELWSSKCQNSNF